MTRINHKKIGVGYLRETVNIVKKDLLLEWRSMVRVNATICFAVVALLLFSFAAGPESKLLSRNAPGYLWLAILLASVLSLGESFRLENENSSLEGLSLLPVKPQAIFAGKAISNTIFIFSLSIVIFPVAIGLYDTQLSTSFLSALSVFFLGSAAISAPGTLYSAISCRARARDVLLPLLLFPIIVPALVCSVKATQLVFNGDPMGQLNSWILLLTIFNVVYWILCSILFGRVIEE